MFFHMAEYCDTLQSKERRNRENKACLNDRALRLLDHDVTWKSQYFSAIERGDILKNSDTFQKQCPLLVSSRELCRGKGLHV